MCKRERDERGVGRMIDIVRASLTGYVTRQLGDSAIVAFDEADVRLTSTSEPQVMSLLEKAIEGLKVAGFPNGYWRIFSEGEIVSSGEYGENRSDDVDPNPPDCCGPMAEYEHKSQSEPCPVCAGNHAKIFCPEILPPR
jgi:hypothetical protein